MDVDLPKKISCPLFPHSGQMVTMAQVQLDHDQNLNTAGVEAEPDFFDDIKGDINNPQPHSIDSYASFLRVEKY